jgi:hypothetical protein
VGLAAAAEVGADVEPTVGTADGARAAGGAGAAITDVAVGVGLGLSDGLGAVVGAPVVCGPKPGVEEAEGVTGGEVTAIGGGVASPVETALADGATTVVSDDIAGETVRPAADVALALGALDAVAAALGEAWTGKGEGDGEFPKHAAKVSEQRPRHAA